MLRVVRELILKVLIRKNQIVHICGDGFNEIFYDYCTIYTNIESLDCTLKPMLYIYYMSVFFFFHYSFNQRNDRIRSVFERSLWY